MPSAARRRRPVQAEESSEEEAPQTQRRRRHVESEDESEEDAEPDSMEVDGDQNDTQDQVVKKLVRYALACEFQRRTIKRADIAEKGLQIRVHVGEGVDQPVIGKQHRGTFKRIFDSAQHQLRTKFGMEMVQVTSKEKITMKEKRAAQKTKGTSKAPPTYILTTILPSEFRVPEIMPASNIESEFKEATYIGICTTIVSIISLSSNDSVPDHKLLQYLERLNLEKNSGLGKTDSLLAKMVKDGYIYKTVEKTVDDEQIDWRVGARGKVEIGNKGIQGLVREVYGENAPDDLDKKLQRSLGMDIRKVGENGENGAEEEEEEEAEDVTKNGDPGPSTNQTRRQNRR